MERGIGMAFAPAFLLALSLLSFLLGRECTPEILSGICGMPEAKTPGWFLLGATLVALMTYRKQRRGA
ncbi:hypothetical protein [Thermus scotoductus]|uniref:Uncharacterized protein n=1 Tax=Thermus scotoductus TaxID=37636 RepID=A0A430S2J6_THESC|nr:hypothetical protein [Thermus scotoductus]RTG96803.1 hypothetical protein CSW51_04425 [Thermus scotoductus]RTH27957.1 hypothetical protein CSW38_01970 [Thermus scotoductus]